MADWSLIRTTLGTWVTTVTGLTTYWRRRPRPAHFGDAYALLDIVGRRTVGNDEVIQEYDATAAAGSQIRRYQVGQRQFTLPIQIRTSRQADDNDALEYTSLIRDQVYLPETSDDEFRAADIAIARILSEVEIDARLDNRDLSVAQIDLLMNAANLTEGIATGWIETLDDFEFYDVENPAPPLWTGDIDVG
jgi:hypothetical protein